MPDVFDLTPMQALTLIHQKIISALVYSNLDSNKVKFQTRVQVRECASLEDHRLIFHDTDERERNACICLRSWKQ